MTDGGDEARALLDVLLSRTEAIAPAESDQQSTISVLRSLSEAGAPRVAAEKRIALEVLCRKLSVAGVVWDRYTTDWKKLPNTKALCADAYALLAAVLLLHASVADADSSGERGQALKLVNGSFQALDLAAEVDSKIRRELDVLSTKLLRTLPVGG